MDRMVHLGALAPEKPLHPRGNMDQFSPLVWPPIVVALIPTRNRPELLRNRSLPSVLRQTRAPNHIIVVDDSSPHLRYETRQAVTALRESHPSAPAVTLLANTRAAGAAGAWNTGLYQLAEQYPAERVFVAFLDDDDAWEPEHLAKVLESFESKQLDVVATGLLRIEREGDTGRTQLPPSALDAAAFLVGNPHVQGSNLVARLSTLLSVGGFDEALPSCTDRDLCLRLMDIEGLRYGAVESVTVRHHAEAERARLSTAGSRAKHAGLDGFWRKYRDRMTDAQRQAFIDRGERLFLWQPPGDNPPDVWFVVGITADAGTPQRVVPLLQDLLLLGQQPGIAGIDVVVLENGPLPDGDGLRAAVEAVRKQGLRLWLVPLERQQEAASAGAYGQPFARGDGRAAIATTRSMLQVHVYALARLRPGAVAWILDDDKRLTQWTAPGRAAQLGDSLLRLRAAGISVALGVDAEAPPLPMLATLRGELHDLKCNLELLNRLGPDAVVPNRSNENREVCRRSHSPYHDLAQGDGRHLETPLWWVPLKEGEKASQSFAEIVRRLDDLLQGRPVFRGLAAPDVLDAADVVASAVPSSKRGGCAWILDVEALRGAPNVAASFDGDLSRRSDMLWSLLLDRHLGYRVVQVPIAVTHERSLPLVNDPFADLLRDVRGHALHLALQDLFDHRGQRDDVPPLLFNAEEEQYFCQRFGHHLQVRIAAFERSAHRIRALTDAVARMVPTQVGPDAPWWLTAPEQHDNVCRIRDVLRALDQLLRPGAIVQWVTAARATQTTAVLSFLRDLPAALASWQDALLRHKDLAAMLEAEREKNARAGLALLVGVTPSATLLGAGYEGIVFQDGGHVYKWFDAWPLRKRSRQRSFVKGLVGQLDGAQALPRLNRLIESAGHIVMRYAYEESAPYEGGHGPGLYRLLRECRAYGIVCNNLHPSNLRVAGDRVLLVDFGADIAPFTEEGFTAMVRRAWLCFRFWFRSDLNTLLTRSLREPELPELEGVAGLVVALEEASPIAACRRMLAEAVQQSGARTVLDYGCGKGDLAQELAAVGIRTVAYDPDPTLVDRWSKGSGSERNVTFGGADLIQQLRWEGQRFDAVVCSLVLCVLDDAPAYEAVLADLRRLVHESGTVLVAVCNPFATHGASTPFKGRPRNLQQSYDETFAWSGRAGETGTERQDVHRPLHVLERDLLRHGLVCTNRRESETVDLHRFEPASDFMVLTLRPSAAVLPITLAIKTCAMDFRTLEPQVRHLVEQLEGPEVFSERLLVVDARLSGFTRAHDDANPEELEAVINRLLRARLIDRVVRCPVAEEARCALNARWFGLSTPATHAQNGNPVTATLAAFEACRTPYLLQVDSDLLLHRPAPRDRALGRLLDALQADPQAVTVSLPITSLVPTDPAATGDNGPFRVEVRGSLLALSKLRSLRPLPNDLVDGVLALGWHRALDGAVRLGQATSLRIADPQLGFIHPPNSRKFARDEWMTILDRCTAGQLPPEQIGKVDLCTPVEAWLGPKRAESVVVILQGRDVPLGRLRRALDSLARQRHANFGAILMDDGSSPPVVEYLRAFPPRLLNFSLVHTPLRRGGMANLVWAVRHVCTNPESIIVLLDADDVLIGDRVLDKVIAAHRAGADLTVGSMLRTDKQARYTVHFEGARHRRGGGAVWQHLRSFSKRLFDAIPDDALRLDGKYIEVAQDWAYMLPMVELAKQPVALAEPLYLYEPSGEGKNGQRAWREEIIGRIVAKAPLHRADAAAELGVACGKAS